MKIIDVSPTIVRGVFRKRKSESTVAHLPNETGGETPTVSSGSTVTQLPNEARGRTSTVKRTGFCIGMAVTLIGTRETQNSLVLLDSGLREFTGWACQLTQQIHEVTVRRNDIVPRLKRES